MVSKILHIKQIKQIFKQLTLFYILAYLMFILSYAHVAYSDSRFHKFQQVI